MSIDGLRLRFWLWTAAMAALLMFYALRIAPELRIDADLYALLPAQELEPAVAAAQSQYADALSRKLLFLVGSADEAQARTLATQFAARLREARVFETVSLENGGAKLDSTLLQGYRRGLLADSQRELLIRQQGQTLLAQALREAYSPGLLPHLLPLAQDPFNFLGAFMAQQAAGLGELRPRHGLLMLTSQGVHQVLIVAQLGEEPFSGDTQDRVVPVIRAAEAQARAAGGQVLASGLLLHAAAAAQRARSEVQWVGGLSLFGVAAMLLLTFRSPRPLLLGVLILGSGALAALSLCQLLFGRVTLIALVFGSGLIGVAVDYSTHFLADQFRDRAAWTPRLALRHVGPGIAMGMGCAVLGYLSLGLTPLPGLRQRAVCAGAGLVGACGGVLCWYPLLAPPARPGEPLPLRWALHLDGALGNGLVGIGRRRGRLAAATLAALALVALTQVEFADDIHLLNSTAPDLQASDERMRELLPGAPDSQFFLVQGGSPDEVLAREEQLREALAAQIAGGALESYRALSRALPSAQRQRDNQALLAAQVYTPGGIGPQLMTALGFPPALIAARLAEFEAAAPVLTFDAWLADAASAPHRDLWLGDIGDGYASIVSLIGIRDFAALRALTAQMPGVQFVDRAASVSELLGRYRRLALLLLATAYALIGLALALRYGAAAAARLLAAPLGAGLITLALLGTLSGGLNLFHVLGLFVVLGLGVDYAVFLREGVAARAATVLAISLSTLGAVLSYGLLAFSATPFIRAIGLTLLIGVSCTWVLALLMQRPAVALAPDLV